MTNKIDMLKKIDENFESKFEQFIKSKKKDGLDDKSLTMYLINLKKFGKYLLDNSLKYTDIEEEHLTNYIKILANDGIPPKTLNQQIATLRGFYSYLENVTGKKNPASDIHHIKIDKSEKYEDKNSVRDFILTLEKNGEIELKEKLIIYLVSSFGLSGANICDIKMDHISCENGDYNIKLPFKTTITITPKQKTIYDLFDLYYKDRSKLPSKNTYFFLTFHGKPLTRPHIIYILQKICKKMNFTNFSLVTLANANLLLSQDEIDVGLIIDGKYKIESLLLKDETSSLYKISGLSDTQQLRVLRFYPALDYQNYKDKIESILKILTNLSHTNICFVYSFGYLDNPRGVYTIEEYVEEKPLLNLITKLNIKEIKSVFQSLLLGVSAYHEKGFLHLNISPNNIFYFKENDEIVPKLTNINILRLIDYPNDDFKYDSFTSPELIENKKIDERCDIYSLGMTLYFLISGKLPFGEGNSKSGYIELNLQVSNYPEYFNNIIMKMISQNPEDRFNNLHSVLVALKNVASHGSIYEISIAPPLPTDSVEKIEKIIDNFNDINSDNREFIVGISGKSQNGQGVLVDKIKKIVRARNLKLIEMDCSNKTPALSISDNLKLKHIDEEYKNYKIGNSVNKLYDFDYIRKKNNYFENLYESIAKKSQIVFIISNLDKATTNFIDTILFIARKTKETNLKTLIIYSISDDGPLPPSLSVDFEVGDFLQIALSPLSRADLKKYLGEMFNAKITDEFLDFVYEKSDGKSELIYGILREFQKKEAICYNNKGSLEIEKEFLDKSKHNISDYLKKDEISLKIFNLLACLQKPISVNELKSLFFDYCDIDATQFKKTLAQLVMEGYLESTSFDVKELIQFPSKFNIYEYYQKIENNQRIILHKLIASKKEAGGKFDYSKFIDILEHLYLGNEHSKALKYLFFIIESSCNEGLLDDAIIFLQKASKYTDFYSKQERFYLSLINSKLQTDLNNFKGAENEYNGIDLLAENNEERLLALAYKARFLIKKGGLKNALNILEEGLQIVVRDDNRKFEIQIVVLKCTALIMMAEFDKAGTILDHYLSCNKYDSYKDNRLYLLNLRALLCFYESKYDEAISLLQDIYQNASILKNSYLESSSLYTSAMVYYRKTDYKKAIEYYTKTLNILEKKHDILGRVTTINSLAILYQKTGEFIKAFEIYKTSLTTYKTLGQYLGSEDLLLGMATLYFNLGAIQDSRKYLKMAENQQDKSHNKHHQGYCLWIRANINKYDGDIDTALSNYNLAIEIFQKGEFVKEYLSVILNKIELLTVSERMDDATVEFEKLNKHFTENFQDVSLQKIIEEVRFEIYNDVLDNNKILNSFDQIENNPLFKSDWQISLNYYNLKIIYFSKIGDIENTKRVVEKLNDRVIKLTPKIPDNLRDYFINIYTPLFSEFPIVKFSTEQINRDILFDILFKISGTLNEEILIDKILKYFIFITNSQKGFIVFYENSTMPRIALVKNKYNQNLIKVLPEEYLKLINSENSSIDKVFTHRIDSGNSEQKSLIVVVYNQEINFVLCGEVEDDIVDLDNEFKKSLQMFANQTAISLLNSNKYSRVKKEAEELLKEKADKFSETKTNNIDDNKSGSIFAFSKSYRDELPSQEKKTKASYDGIIGKSEKMRRILTDVGKMAQSDAPILIMGETGTGKDLIARTIHEQGRRKNNLFFAENCAVFHDTLLESELFGYSKGSYTGAEADSSGIFEIADGGTVFLDEVGDMSLNMQKKLLRVLQEGEVRRIGGRATIKVDVRIISATNRDLAEMIKEGKFRDDLYFRLNTLSVKIPPLRERREDIEELIYYFLDKYNKEKRAGKDLIDYDVVESLTKYDWPGNIRELQNEIQRLLVLSDYARITKKTIEGDLRYTAGFS